MDIVTARNKSLWGLWELGHEEHIHTHEHEHDGKMEIAGQNEVEVNLNKEFKGKTTMKLTIKPKDKNPAFDFRVTKTNKNLEFKHVGRKYYYDLPEGSDFSNTEPHISSRGVSMYIIEKVLRSTARFENARKILAKLSENQKWDIGTRPWEGWWAKQMISDPFDWGRNLANINKPAPVKSKEELAQMYDIKKW